MSCKLLCNSIATANVTAKEILQSFKTKYCQCITGTVNTILIIQHKVLHWVKIALTKSDFSFSNPVSVLFWWRWRRSEAWIFTWIQTFPAINVAVRNFILCITIMHCHRGPITPSVFCVQFNQCMLIDYFNIYDCMSLYVKQLLMLHLKTHSCSFLSMHSTIMNLDNSFFNEDNWNRNGLLEVVQDQVLPVYH